VALRLLVLALLLWQTSCTSLHYVAQGAAGQDDLNRRARDIDELIREKRVDARMRGLLSQVGPIKSFGERHGLTPTRNYTKYVRVHGSAVVWAVSAAEPLRFRSKSWSFPLVGSFTFLNWFKQADADAFAADLRQEGWDVNVREVGAYSTAGYFEDAVLSSMIPEGKRALGYFANTILHESAHATVLVKHQSTLNESVANFIGDKLAQVYLEETLGAGAEETRAYLASERASEERGRAMQAAFLSL
jgi:predicted aminopeptidase